MWKKKLITIKENEKWKNLESQDKKTLEKKKNKELIKKAKKWKLPWYHVVKEGNKEEYLRSNPDRKKKNNLDPKRKVKK